MAGCSRELALSEVIGFLMIVALLSILFSMYLVYVVPIQGRDAEIAHMDQIKEDMTGIKMDIDSLIVNKKLNYPIQRAIPLGTSSGSASGAFSMIPIQTYTGSSGSLSVDTRQANVGSLEVFLKGTPVIPQENIGPQQVSYSVPNTPLTGSPSSMEVTPQSLIIYYNVLSPADTSPNISIYTTTHNSTSNWSVTAQVVPRYDKMVNLSAGNVSPSDLTITIRKESNITMDNITIARDVSSAGNPYPINLYDWGYGLADSLQQSYNFTYSVNGVVTTPDQYSIGQVAYTPLTKSGPDTPESLQFLPATGLIDSNPAITHPLSLFEYESQNKYWLNQNYQYQWGAMAVEQTDGTSVLYTPPISIQNAGGIFQVKITDTVIQTHNPLIFDTSISGNQNNPTLVSVSDLRTSINGYEILDGTTNANYIIISTITPDTSGQTKWSKIFALMRTNAIRNGRLDAKYIAVTDKPCIGDTGFRTSLIIARDDNPVGFDLNVILANPAINTIQDLITDFNNPGGVTDIDEEHIKISYQTATVPISLYNLAQ